MARYHVKKDGTPGICHAQPGKCPLGGEGQHFKTIDEAQEYADKEHLNTFTDDTKEENDFSTISSTEADKIEDYGNQIIDGDVKPDKNSKFIKNHKELVNASAFYAYKDLDSDVKESDWANDDTIKEETASDSGFNPEDADNLTINFMLNDNMSTKEKQDYMSNYIDRLKENDPDLKGHNPSNDEVFAEVARTVKSGEFYSTLDENSDKFKVSFSFDENPNDYYYDERSEEENEYYSHLL